MKKLTKMYPLLLMFVALTPLVAAAAKSVLEIVEVIQDVVNIIVPLFMTVAVAVFLWGIIMYITAGGDAEKEKTARGYIIYGLIGLFVLVAFWGLIAVITTTFDVSEGVTPIAPQVYFDAATT